MKKLTKVLLAASTALAATSSVAFVDTVSPIVGVDYHHVWMKDANQYSGYLPKSYPGATAYLGARICECLGIELGQDWSTKKTKSGTDSTRVNFKEQVQRRATHLDLIGYLPIADCIELMGGLGVGYVYPKFHETYGGTSYTYKPKATVARVRVGGNYMLSECIGARALLGWESTSSVHFSYAGTKYKPFKDSVTAALGLFYKF